MNPPSVPPTLCRRALLETTIQVDRKKTGHRQAVIERLLEGFEWKFSTSITLLEFKATIIEACIFLHGVFRRSGSRFSDVLDAVTESQHRQQALRLHIIHNMVQITEGLFRNRNDRQERLAEIAYLQLENVIPQLYDWFSSPASVDQVLNDRIACTRAMEKPVKKVAKFETNLPRCIRDRNKRCQVEKVIRQHGPRLVKVLEPLATPSGEPNPNQFRRTLDVIQSVLANPKADLSHEDCRNAGDFLIGIEAEGHATEALSTNAREWEVVAKEMGMQFVHVKYPDERPWSR
ncbi:MAG: hypothetical protein JWO38_6287 [Gemmataceae bacterium]|nr:hypothetical protein [Gemmataceae bacterium]